MTPTNVYVYMFIWYNVCILKLISNSVMLMIKNLSLFQRVFLLLVRVLLIWRVNNESKVDSCHEWQNESSGMKCPHSMCMNACVSLCVCVCFDPVCNEIRVGNIGPYGIQVDCSTLDLFIGIRVENDYEWKCT